MRAWTDALAAASARGASVRILDVEGARPHLLPGATFALVVDGRRAFLGHRVPDDGHPSEGNDTGLDVDQEGIVALLASLLGSRWRAPRAVSVEAGTGRPTLQGGPEGLMR
jgi:hypothetical protein